MWSAFDESQGGSAKGIGNVYAKQNPLFIDELKIACCEIIHTAWFCCEDIRITIAGRSGVEG